MFYEPDITKARDPWEFEKSIFARFVGARGDKKGMLDKCFEIDW